ncbi:MAG: ABC-2 type transport system ATP-binding protein [Myxococcota bacterium]|jgi:ABC-2 type transport system ATP-binding protein
MIQVEDLHVRFGEVRAVDGLSLQVEAGAMLGLLGPNGAGKSTTIACMAGLLTPHSGRVTVDGTPVEGNANAVKRKLGIVPQHLALYDDLNVRQNLEIVAGLYGLGGGERRSAVARALALSQLEGRAKVIVGTLSGGMKRRLNLAASLLHSPPILICDEPTTGVDPQSRNHIFDTIRALHQEGLTVIYTTHYMEEVEVLCDQVAIVDHGRVIAHDQLENLVADGRSLEDVFLDLTGRALRDAT